MMTSFKENIKNLFYPDDYPILLPQNANIDFILMKKKRNSPILHRIC